MPVKISALPSLGTMTDAAIIPVVASSTTSQISGANLKTYFSSVTGNITGGNINTGGVVSATGNITGSQFSGSGAGLTSIPGANVSGTVANATYATSAGSATTAGTVTTAAQGNITSVGTLTTLVVTGNITGGNILGGANVNATTHTGTTVSVTGNVTGGNLNAAGLSLSGNVVSAINTTSAITTTANITGGNVITSSRTTTKTLATNKVALGTLSGAVAIDCSAGSYQTFTTGGNVAISFTNWPATGTYQSVSLEVTVSNTSHIISGPLIAMVNSFGIVGLDYAAGTITFPVTGVYTFEFSSSDAGSTIAISENNSILRPYNSSSDVITATSNAVVGLGTTYSIFYPTPVSTPGTATLANGVPGQTKVLSNFGSGTWRVIIATAPWGSPSGNINLNGTLTGATVVWSTGIGWIPLNLQGNVTLT